MRNPLLTRLLICGFLLCLLAGIPFYLLHADDAEGDPAAGIVTGAAEPQDVTRERFAVPLPPEDPVPLPLYTPKRGIGLLVK